MEEVVNYGLYWKGEQIETRLGHTVGHLADELIEHREMVTANTKAQGEARSAITAIEEEKIAYSYVPDELGDDASQYYPRELEYTKALDSQKSAVGDGAPGRAVEKIARHPKLWKQFLITVAGVYPLTVMIPVTLTWLSHFLAPLRVFAIRGVISATLLVACLLFVALPLFNRVFRRWLAS